MNMITVTLQYGDNYVDVEFPCSDNYLQSRLNELHYEGNFLQHAFVHEVIEPKELAILEKTFVNPDELNYLAKRMDSFWGDEEIQFYEAAKYRGCATPKDLINMTFNLQKYTLIRDISNLGKVGQDYLLNTQGSIPAHDDDNPKYAALARELLSSGKGIVTDSGLLFDNPELEFDEVYDGHVFPPYYYDNSMLSTIRADYGGRSEYLYLPCESISIQKALMRLGASEIKDVDFSVEDCMFESQEWNDRIEDMLANDGIRKLNAFLGIVSAEGFDYDKMDAVIEYAGVSDGTSLINLAKNMDKFTFVNEAKSYYDVGAYLCKINNDFFLPPHLNSFFDYAKYGQQMSDKQSGEFTSQGFVSLVGNVTLPDILPDKEPTMKLGGM